jgi:hypothetical protein
MVEPAFWQQLHHPTEIVGNPQKNILLLEDSLLPKRRGMVREYQLRVKIRIRTSKNFQPIFLVL